MSMAHCLARSRHVQESPRYTPMLNTVSQDKIERGVVFSDEPGIYDERGGVRIEDLIAITDNGAEVLTHSPKDLRTIEPSRE
jgi:Xaa-Pro aminopeptidase